jgi:hypothetical protein
MTTLSELSSGAQEDEFAGVELFPQVQAGRVRITDRWCTSGSTGSMIRVMI